MFRHKSCKERNIYILVTFTLNLTYIALTTCASLRKWSYDDHEEDQGKENDPWEGHDEFSLMAVKASTVLYVLLMETWQQTCQMGKVIANFQTFGTFWNPKTGKIESLWINWHICFQLYLVLAYGIILTILVEHSVKGLATLLDTTSKNTCLAEKHETRICIFSKMS